MVIILFRVLIVYLIVLIYLRIMGKRQLGEMQPFELVLTLLLADIASLPMTQNSMPVLYSVVPLTALVVIHFFVGYIAKKSITMRKIINGKPVLVITPKGIQYEALKELNMTIDDLMEGVRSCNYFKLEDVLYVIVETNGSFSVIPKVSSSPVTSKQLGLTTQENALPVILVSGGKVLNENLTELNVTQDFILNVLKKYEIANIKDVLLFTLDNSGSVYIQDNAGKVYSEQIDYRGR